MTRESKLALIVGFGLVLFVGILVSDHFSSGQRQEAAHLLAQRGALRGAAAPISIQPLVPEATPESVKASFAKGNEAAAPPAGQSVPPPGNPSGPGSERANATPSGASNSPTPAGSNAPASPTTPSNDRRGSGELVIGGPTPSKAGSPNASLPAEGAVAAKLYPVKDGETLYSICASQYGDGSLWKSLAEFNKSAVPNPSRMRKGVTLRLPPVEVLKPGAKPTVDPSAGAVAKSGSSATPAPANPPAPGTPAPGTPAPSRTNAPSSPSTANTYTVQAGETLSEIAKRTLGSTSRWKEVAKLNQDVIRDPNALQPGTVIRLPSQG